MTDIHYEPPERMYADTLLAFKDFQMSSMWLVRIDPDPLGPVNKILTLMRGQERVRSTLWPVPVGATVRLVRDEGGYRLDGLYRIRGFGWLLGETSNPNLFTAVAPPRNPGWRIEVNDHTVLTVTDAELRPPYIPPPTPPWWQRAQTAIRKRARDLADQIAGELGYHRADECGGWDE